MTLVKLDSGDYINTMYVIKTMTDTAGSVGNKNGQLVYLLDTGYQKITTADRDRIVEAMTNPETELQKRIAGLIQQLNARIKELEPQMRPESISERLTIEAIVQWMSEALDE